MKFKFIFAIFLLCVSNYTYNNQKENKSFSFFNIINSYVLSIQKYFLQTSFPVFKPTENIKVNLNKDLSIQENIFKKNRLEKVTKTLHDSFGIDVPLKIAFCCSGGGNRALVGTLGLLSGAAKTKLLDATMYLAGVSGSTWAIIPYVYQKVCLQKNSTQALDDLIKYFSNSLSAGTRISLSGYHSPALLPFKKTDDFLIDLMVQYAYNQDMSLVNLFGPLIGEQNLGFIGDRSLAVRWSEVAPKFLAGESPLPICMASFRDNSHKYAYFEMSPFESGSTLLGYIPTQYLGSKFNNGTLDHNGINPEYSLAFYMGVYGSAFAAVVQYLYDAQYSRNRSIDPLLFLFEPSTVRNYNSYKSFDFFSISLVKNKVKELISSLVVEQKADIYAHFVNYNPAALQGSKDLGLFDAGIGCAFPISALIDRPKREVDLILMYDSHPGSVDVEKVYDYAISQGIVFDAKMKNLSIEELGKDSMLVFNDPRTHEYVPSVATILYFPTQGIDIDKPPYTTFNFKYEVNDVEKLKNITESALISNFEIIKDIMNLLTKKYKNF